VTFEEQLVEALKASGHPPAYVGIDAHLLAAQIREHCAEGDCPYEPQDAEEITEALEQIRGLRCCTCDERLTTEGLAIDGTEEIEVRDSSGRIVVTYEQLPRLDRWCEACRDHAAEALTAEVDAGRLLLKGDGWTIVQGGKS
jgi:hypothetical protein